MECKTTIGLVLVISTLFAILYCLLRKNESFFNLRSVIKQHLLLFKDAKLQYVVFYVFPLLFSVGLCLLYSANDDLYEQISVIVGIILSILLAVLSILTSKQYNVSEDDELNKRVKTVIKETINAISFATLICVFLMTCCLVVIVVDGISVASWVKSFILCGTFYCFIVLILTMLMIVKRMNNIILFELNLKREKE